MLDVSISGLTLTGGDVTGQRRSDPQLRKPDRDRQHDQRQLGRSGSNYGEWYGGGIYSGYGKLTVTSQHNQWQLSESRRGIGGGIRTSVAT